MSELTHRDYLVRAVDDHVMEIVNAFSPVMAIISSPRELKDEYCELRVIAIEDIGTGSWLTFKNDGWTLQDSE